MNIMKVATLTSSLLARKGTAVPSAFAPTAMPPMPAMPPAPTPPAAAARKTAAADGGAVTRPKRNGTGRIKMSLRLKPDQHLKLKLVAAFRRESAQRLLVAAIERYLDQVAPSAAREEYAWMAELEDELPIWSVPTGRASYDMTG
jgi:hypothetical protein